MPTETQKRKRALRSLNNACAKLAKAEARREADIELGKTVIVTEVDGVKKYAFPPKQKEPPTPPRLTWLGGKMYKHGNARKTQSGHKPEHVAALAENASRILAAEVVKAMTPETPAVDIG
jgi:hypothetical protein